MKVLLLTPTFLPRIGGAEIVVSKTAEYLHKLGVTVNVLSAMPSSVHRGAKWPDVKYPIYYTSSSDRPLSLTSSIIKQAIRLQSNYDIIHCFYLFPSGLWGLLIKGVTGKPCITTVIGFDLYKMRSIGYGERLDPVKDLIIRLIATNQDRIIAVTDWEAKELISMGVKANKIDIVPHGVDLDQFNPNISGEVIRKRLRFHKEEKMVLTVARFDPRKGYLNLVKSIPYVLRKHPNTKFVFCGRENEYMHRVQRKAKALGITRNLLFLGTIDYKEVPMYYAASDIFVLPSFLESGSLAVLEALASGKPVVTTRTGIIPKLIHDGQSGFLIDPKDKRKMADVIIRLLEDVRLQQEVGKAGREAVMSGYSWEAIARRLILIYESI